MSGARGSAREGKPSPLFGQIWPERTQMIPGPSALPPAPGKLPEEADEQGSRLDCRQTTDLSLANFSFFLPTHLSSCRCSAGHFGLGADVADREREKGGKSVVRKQVGGGEATNTGL